MNDLKNIQDILTGDDAVDTRIMTAYERGAAHGHDGAAASQRIQERVKLARAVIRRFHCTPEEAVSLFSLPAKEAKPILKTLHAQIRQKKIAQ